MLNLKILTLRRHRPTMKLLLACLLVAVSTATAKPVQRRFLFDDAAKVVHALVDPLAGLITDSVHVLVGEFDRLVGGNGMAITDLWFKVSFK